MLFSRFRFGVAFASVSLFGSSLEELKLDSGWPTIPPLSEEGPRPGSEQSELFVDIAKDPKHLRQGDMLRREVSRRFFPKACIEIDVVPP